MYKIEYCGEKELWNIKALFTSYQKMASHWKLSLDRRHRDSCHSMTASS